MTAIPSGTNPIDIDQLVGELERARARTLMLIDDLSDAELLEQVSPLMSPLIWDAAHIANYEELWLLRELGGQSASNPAFDNLYDAFDHPRSTRSTLPILGPDETRAYLAQVHDAAIELLTQIDFSHPPSRLAEHGFVIGLILQHEHQHGETMLATHQLRGDRATWPFASQQLNARVGAQPDPKTDAAPTSTQAQSSLPAMQRVDGGAFTMGADSAPWAYDNEGAAHTVELDTFLIDTTPVTNRAYLEFIDDGGYSSASYWTQDGWEWRVDEALSHPQFWHREGHDDWSVLRFGSRLDLEQLLDEPVQHVCWYEADAFARWAGKRLPTEAEWEKAATCSPTSGQQLWPWGNENIAESRANVSARKPGPDPVTAHPDGVSPWGCLAMIGDVWEWTSSNFLPYPGFEAWPYREYSEVFFGDEYKVLRGGSWASDPITLRGTFRNWDYPIRRHIFAGFRCAQDA
ncbi:MAG: ergothioneine biosynthesis protein EgtB [Actinomycetes bacterium]